MAKMAEGIARVTGEIATGRQRRSELAAEIKAQARHRHDAVRSLLTGLRVARGQGSRAQCAELRKVTTVRHVDVNSLLKGFKVSRRRSGVERSAESRNLVSKRRGEVRASLGALQTSRARAGREYRKEAEAIIGERMNEVRALLGQFSREGVARRRHRQVEATEFMRDLTNGVRDLSSGVAVFLDGLDKENRERAITIRKCLEAYALDRKNAVAVWRGKPRQNHGEAAARLHPQPEAYQRPADEHSSAHAKSSLVESVVAKPAEKVADAAHSPETPARHKDTKWAKSPLGHHRGGSK
jgi:hypothetical protein